MLEKSTLGAAAAPLQTAATTGWTAASCAAPFLPRFAVLGSASSAVFSATSCVCTRLSCGQAMVATCSGETCWVWLDTHPASAHTISATARVARDFSFMACSNAPGWRSRLVEGRGNGHGRTFPLLVGAPRAAEVVTDHVGELAHQRAQRDIDEVIVFLGQRHQTNVDREPKERHHHHHGQRAGDDPAVFHAWGLALLADTTNPRPANSMHSTSQPPTAGSSPSSMRSDSGTRSHPQ